MASIYSPVIGFGVIQWAQLSGKVKCTLVQALRLCTGRTAHRGRRGIALPFLDHGTKRGWGVSVTPRPLFIPGEDPVPIVQEAGRAPEPVWTGVDNLVPTGIRSPDRPARSQSLYRLSYRAHPRLSGVVFLSDEGSGRWVVSKTGLQKDEELHTNMFQFNPYPTAFPYGNGMVLHFYQQQESNTTKTVHKVINKELKAYV